MRSLLAAALALASFVAVGTTAPSARAAEPAAAAAKTACEANRPTCTMLVMDLAMESAAKSADAKEALGLTDAALAGAVASACGQSSSAACASLRSTLGSTPEVVAPSTFGDDTDRVLRHVVLFF